MTRIGDQKSLKDWLAGQDSPAAAVTIAARAALRILPLVASDLEQVDANRREMAGAIVLPVFRATALSTVACAYPSRAFTARFTASAGAASAAAAATGAAAKATADAAADAAMAVATADTAAASAAADAAAGRAADAVRRQVSDTLIGGAFPGADFNAGADWGEKQIARFWRAISEDAALIDQGNAPARIAVRHLWPDGTPDWAAAAWASLKAQLRTLGDDWEVWITWYHARLDGRPTYPDAAPDKNAEIEIARALIDDPLWDDGPATVSGEIRRLETEILGEDWEREPPADKDADKDTDRDFLVDFFVSYATEDERHARKVVAVVEAAGYRTFAQFRDIRPGDNFVVRMEEGLKASRRLIAILSPHYVASDMCLSEWAAGFRRDPASRSRTIQPFLVAPGDLGALGGQIVYTSLLDCSDAQAERKILDAIAGARAPGTPQARRRRLAAAASPEPVVDARGRLHIAPNADFDTPVVDADLPRLPEAQRALATTVIASLGGRNVGTMAAAALAEYRDDLNTHGTTPTVGLLNDMAAIIRADMAADTDGIWCDGAVHEALKRFLRNHETIRTHFPLDPEREADIRSADVVPDIVDDPDYRALTDSYLGAVGDLHGADLTTDEFLAAARKRRRLLDDYASLPADPSPHAPDEMFIDPRDRIGASEIKKRHAVQDAAFYDNLLQKAANVATIADSRAGRAVIDLAGKIADLIWSGP